MPLPNTNSNIDERDVFPDRVTILVEYTCLACSQREFTEALGNIPFPDSQQLTHGRLKVSTGNSYAIINFCPPRRGSGIKGYIDFTPLRECHSQRVAFQDERARDDSTNWLHPDDVSPQNLLAYDMFESLYGELEQRIFNYVNEIVGRLFPGSWSNLVRTTFVKAEVALDLASDHPGYLVERCTGNLLRCLPNVARNHYPKRAVSRRDALLNSIMVSGYRRKGERYKVYDKTNKRVRIEAELTSDAMRRLGLNRTVSADRNIVAVFLEIARCVLPTILLILVEQPESELLSLVDVISALALSTNRPHIFREAFTQLSSTGRLCSASFDRQVCLRLARAGVVERTGRGIYSLTPAFRQSFHFLARFRGAFLRSGGRNTQ